jgi:chorismate mutase
MTELLEISAIDNWLKRGDNRILLAGPCSAESETQLLQTATDIAKHYPENIFRAGVWKPRTRPGTFEGVGEEGLKWLQQVKQQTGMRVATEVANAKHVELALKYGIDFLWIGARTSVNPFFVQEIADALKGVDIPVLVKNPLHPDLQLWLGALERISKAGIKKLAAVHRGFFTYEKTEYRNAPRWEAMLELKTNHPELPVICDISHIAGNTHLLPVVAQQSIDLDMAGLMIETHCDPAHALSDAQQQITPAQLFAMVSRLKMRKSTFDDERLTLSLASIRKKIDLLDSELLDLLNERLKLVKDIGALKEEGDVSIFQIMRWMNIVQQSFEKADELGLNRDFVKNILIQIHDESIRIQSEIMNKEKK